MKAAAIAATTASDSVDDGWNEAGIELQPEHEVLYKELSDTRKELLQKFQGRAVKSVMVVAAKLPRENDPEKISFRSCFPSTSHQGSECVVSLYLLVITEKQTVGF
jgi:E3 ubiquitin-protein ligase SHPRH